MKLLVLVVLLTLMQVSIPVPPKAADASVASSKQVADDAANANTKEIVVIREPPPKPDYWYRAYVIFTGALVIIGAMGVLYAVKTLRAIQRQALSMRRQTTHLRRSAIYARRSAIEAKRSADQNELATRLTQRADVLLKDFEVRPDSTERLMGRDTQIIMHFVNFGNRLELTM
jgi:hypothetical protein